MRAFKYLLTQSGRAGFMWQTKTYLHVWWANDTDNHRYTHTFTFSHSENGGERR
jgi:hypothetical protein